MSTQPQDTVARLQQAIQAGVPVPIPGAYEARATRPIPLAADPATPRADAAAPPLAPKP